MVDFKNYQPTITIHGFFIKKYSKKGPHLDKCPKDHHVNLDMSNMIGWSFFINRMLNYLTSGQWTISLVKFLPYFLMDYYSKYIFV
jgi:hypothetical protein